MNWYDLHKLDMCAAVVHHHDNITPCHSCIKPSQSLEKDDLCHPSLRVATVLASKMVSVEIFRTATIFIFANERKYYLSEPSDCSTQSS